MPIRRPLHLLSCTDSAVDWVDILSVSAKRVAAAVLLCIAFASSWARSFEQVEEIAGVVVGVADGDTLTVYNGQAQLRIRLAEIDAPEKDQPFGHRAKQSLSQMCFKRKAVVEVRGRDRYGRVIGRVSCDGVDANAMQVSRGLAWVYESYASDRLLFAFQRAARNSGVGLWADSSPVAPWEWRKASRR